MALVGAAAGIRQGGGDVAEAVQNGIKEIKISNRSHTLCFKAQPARARCPQTGPLLPVLCRWARQVSQI